jgi:hypothetical protein
LVNEEPTPIAVNLIGGGGECAKQKAAGIVALRLAGFKNLWL